MRLWPVVGVLLLVACVPLLPTATPLPTQTPLERRVAAVTAQAWREAGLPAPRGVCRLTELRIEEPATMAEYEARCSYRGVYTPSWACPRWREMAPVAVISPALPRSLVGHQAIHELVHAYMHCSGAASGVDSYDAAHADERVWAGPGGSRPDSVEQRAQRALDGD